MEGIRRLIERKIEGRERTERAERRESTTSPWTPKGDVQL